MSFEFESFTVEELIDRNILAQPLDGNHGDIHPKASDFVPSGVPFVMASDLKNGIVDLKNCSFISEEQARKLRKGFAKTGDVLLSHKATIGRTAILGVTDSEFVVLTPQVTYYRVLNNNILNNRYLKFYFDSSPFQQILGAWAGAGSTRAYLGITAQKKLPIIIPPIALQNKVAEFVGALDDRIALLRETNTTLESIAQALFKSWFVDFDPVHANAGTQAPSLPPEIQSLFPSTFVESPLGLVPEGWSVGTVSDLGEVICGKTPPTSDEENYGNDVPFITIPDMHNVLAVTRTARRLSEKGANLQKKKFLRAGSICVSCIATPGLVSMVTQPSQTNQQINSVVPFGEWEDGYPLFALRLIGDRVRASGSGGSVFHNLSKSGFERIEMLLPPLAIANQFNDHVAPLVTKIIENQKFAEYLSSLRDTLLPRLISGQLRLPEVEEVINDV